jgi:hypothetical protein
MGEHPIAGAALIAWIPITLALFALLPPRRAVLVSVIGGTLFLPMYTIELPGPDLTKLAAATAPALVGAVLFDWGRFAVLRLNRVDLGMGALILGAIPTSVTNGLGLYDGIFFAITTFASWGAAYVLGRAYFADREGLRELGVAIFVGGLAYAPFCLWEIRMSPNLHYYIYGFQQHSFGQHRRFGGWRPMVFMQHGLGVGSWMACASLVGLWLWWGRSMRTVWGAPAGALVAGLWVVTALVKSGNAYFMMALGLAAMVWTRGLWSRMALAAAVVAAPTYMVLRGSDLWDGWPLLEVAESVLNEDRAASLETRLVNEDALAAKAREQPLLGWGAWGRNRVKDDYGEDQSVTDGLWIIVFGQRGLVGIVGLTVAMLGGAAVVAWRLRGRRLVEASWAPAVAMVVIVGLVMIDNLFNAMLNPVYTMAAGGLATLAFSRGEWRSGRRGPDTAGAGSSGSGGVA